MPADWQDWLRYHRVELNAMTTPQFIAWLDDKMAAFGNGKLVPPAGVLTEDLSETLEDRLHRQITEQILREARIEEKVAAALQADRPARAGGAAQPSVQRCSRRPACGVVACRHRAGRGPAARSAGDAGASPESGP